MGATPIAVQFIGHWVLVGISHQKMRGKSSVNLPLCRNCDQGSISDWALSVRRPAHCCFLFTLCETQMMKPSAQTSQHQTSQHHNSEYRTYFSAARNLLGSGRTPMQFTVLTATLLSATPAFAHHAFGSRLPINLGEGFLAGLAHPIIGPDHFAFVVAAGLLAVNQRRGWLIPCAFMLTAMAGTSLHLTGMNISGVELLISGSVLLFGILLALKESPNIILSAGLGAIAGLFHGYAYGESIFGAGMQPLLAYLAGFTTIQLIISLGAMAIGNLVLKRQQQPGFLRAAGLVIAGVGLALLATQLTTTLLPV
jgi:urease accessory protein